MSQLDATVIHKLGKELIDEVCKVVGDSQAFVLTPLPNEILLTEEQYKSLLPYDEYLMAMSDYSVFTDMLTTSNDKLFYTPHNVMEVRVKGVGDGTAA